MSKLAFQYRKLQYEDLGKVMDFIKKFYSNSEAVSVGLRDNFQEMDAFRTESKLKHGVSVGMFEKSSDKLVATVLSTLATDYLEPPLAVYRRNSIHVPPGYASVIRLRDYVEQNCFDQLQTDKIFFMSMGTVDPQCRRLGLVTDLKRKSDKIAFEYGCKYIATLPTSDFIWKSNEKLGYRILEEVKLTDYVDVLTGLKPFADRSDPYAHWRLVYKEVNGFSHHI